MKNLAIVVIAFNRVNSLKRLLNSLNNLNVEENEQITLYISIDKDKNNSKENLDVFYYAKEFKWKFGEKIVDFRKENMGLRNHILDCGKLTNIYENIIVLEDDLLVSPLMYKYACQVIDFYKHDTNIAGFGLYSFQRNFINDIPFYPMNNGSDIYFMQCACSWGQIWTKDRWNSFYSWYEKNKNTNFSGYVEIPKIVLNWRENSWLKFHIIYTILTNKYFVYPQIGLTTNFTDVGTHNNIASIAYQSYMYNDNTEKVSFKFVSLDKANNIYDAFFENIKLKEIARCDKEIIADIYGEKDIKLLEKKDRYLLSSNIYNYKIIKSYSLQMYPYEMNLINNIKGKDIFLYDKYVFEKNQHKCKKEEILKYFYRLDALSKNDIFNIIMLFIGILISRIGMRLRRK